MSYFTLLVQAFVSLSAYCNAPSLSLLSALLSVLIAVLAIFDLFSAHKPPYGIDS